MQNVRKKDEDQTNNQASPFTVVKSMLVWRILYFKDQTLSGIL